MLTRREALRLIAATAVAPLASCSAPREGRGAADGYGGFRMSIATYSLRAFPIERAVEMISALGLRYAEVNPIHMPVGADAAKVAEARGIFDALGVHPWAFGVFYTERFPADRRKAIEDVFAMARDLKVHVISCDPEPDWLDEMEEIAERTGVRLGIHNHGAGSRYATTESLLRAVDGRQPNVGVTLDTGHLLCAGEDPLKAVRAFGARLHGCHLKDARAEENSLVLGRGSLDLVGFLGALRDVRFDGALSIEYERNEKDPVPDIRICLDAVRDAASRL